MYGDLVHEAHTGHRERPDKARILKDGRVRIGGRWDAHPALATVRRQLRRLTKTSVFGAALPRQLSGVTQTPVFGVIVIVALVFAGAVGAAAPPFRAPAPTVRGTGITPVAAVVPVSSDPAGPMVVSLVRPLKAFHIAAATVSAPPPTVVVNSPGALGIPSMALSAYRNAERMMANAYPNCGISWNLLAGIGRIESMHANGGATDARGTAVRPIYGPALDGTLPGNEVIVQNSAPGRVTFARAMGPMQFLPGTWARYASDGDGDGVADPQNLYDSTLAAARYLCSGGLDLRDSQQVLSAILRYNNSMPYAQNVLGWAAAYATGVVPVDLPPRTAAARRHASGAFGERRGHRARVAAQHPRPPLDRPAGADAADRSQPIRCSRPAADVAVGATAAAAGSALVELHGDLHRAAGSGARAAAGTTAVACAARGGAAWITGRPAGRTPARRAGCTWSATGCARSAAAGRTAAADGGQPGVGSGPPARSGRLTAAAYTRR